MDPFASTESFALDRLSLIRRQAEIDRAALRHSGARMPSIGYGRDSYGRSSVYLRSLRRFPRRRTFLNAANRFVADTSLNRRLHYRMSRRRPAVANYSYFGSGLTNTRTALPARRTMPLFSPVRLRQERKMIHHDLSIISITDTPRSEHINPIPRSTGVFSRESARVKMLGLHIILDMSMGIAQSLITYGGLTAWVDMWLVYDRHPTGTIPAWADIFDHTGIKSQPQLSARDRFLFLQSWTRFLNLTPVIVSAGEDEPDKGANGFRARVSVDVPLNLDAVWSASNTDGTLSGMTRGALYFYWVSDYPETTANHPVVSADFRLQFADM